ncbi:hypothetical protein JL101_023440 [Skermanella rosea]|uniref:hypothetical protein n=1 Tax=Skermanella rosea TaxID=1817965 RepID=UPI0019335A58|nr:hypothetical protein [Skermanella rosea]UEM02896.1 hypothetical protein JL101_023440 [Skermanella rosea]
MGRLIYVVFAVLLGCLANATTVHATAVFRFDGETTRGLYSMAFELGFSDAVLDREGNIPVEDLEWATATYQYAIDEFDLSSPSGPPNRVTMGNGMQYPFVDPPNLTGRPGTIAQWGEVRIDGERLVFGDPPPGRRVTALGITLPCLPQGDDYYCYPLDDYFFSMVGDQTRLVLFQDEGNCGQGFSFCEAIGTFQLVGPDSGTSVPEPAPLALLVGGILAGGWLGLRGRDTAQSLRRAGRHR